MFAQLVLVFTCRVEASDYLLSLIQMLGPSSQNTETQQIDRSLSIHWWHMWPQNQCEVISLHSIICGVLFVADSKYKGDYFLIDTLDDDMYL